ncbi:MAG: family 10 glycosylhydrolase, partial [Verrucomicrobiia bacterium]
PTPYLIPPQAGEIRGVWVSDTARLDWDRATAQLKRNGFNAMYVNFATAGGAFYPGSRVLPDVSGMSAKEFERGIFLAHKRGLAVHAKLVVMFMFRSPPDFQRKMVAANRVMRGPNGKPILQGGYGWLCPSQKNNHDLMVACVREMVKRYPVDGVQFDYLRFSEQPSCFCANCRRAFEQWHGKPVKHWPYDVKDGPLTQRFIEWKQQIINQWTRDLSDAAHSVRTNVTVSAAVFHDLDRAREEMGQDWKLWLERGWLDYVCTMTYTTDPREFEVRVRQQEARVPRQQLVVGIASWKLDHLSALVAQINATRILGTSGFVLFSYDDALDRRFLPNLNLSPGR